MTEKEKTARQILIDGDIDGIPIDMEDIKNSPVNDKGYIDVDLTQVLGLTDNIYILIGIDLRWLKRFNPKNHMIF
ncbi:MAG: hypothetical protein Q4Q22_03365 [Methanosphaera sp.]|nr:hypothetical protein [Methanosphaera sp.]